MVQVFKLNIKLYRSVDYRFHLLNLGGFMVNENNLSETILNNQKPVIPVRVLYIMGSGRSGSTVLDIALGNHSKIDSYGELINMTGSVMLKNENCACGEKGSDCPFWNKVCELWKQKTGINDLAEYASLQSIFEHYSARNWVRLLREKGNPSTMFKIYSKYTLCLFESIREVSGKQIIVDSSKNPLRAYALSQVPGIDLRIVHLVRDGRGVAWSLKKSYKKNIESGLQKDITSRSILRTAAFWIFINLLSNWVRKKLHPEFSIRVRYEDFIKFPDQVLEEIGDLIDCDLSEVADVINNKRQLTIGHTIAGNRLRMLKTLNLRLDEEWRDSMSPSDKWMFWTVTSCVMGQYQYTKR